MSIRPGDEWGTTTDAAPDLVIHGGDADLARALKSSPHLNPLISFKPNADSDLAKSIGLSTLSESTQVEGTFNEEPSRERIAAPIDAIQYKIAGDTYLAMNAVEVGVSPIVLRATSKSKEITVTIDGRKFFSGVASGVVVANGQFIGEADLIPRSHPGDGRIEVHVYSLKAGERSAMRRRLATGSHIPHPRISTGSGARIRIEVKAGAWPVRADSELAGRTGRIEFEVQSPVARLLL